MTTQRDRLAALLRDIPPARFVIEKGDRHDPFRLANADALADALLARGVRVVDGLTLARAVHETVGSPMDDLTTSDPTSCRDVADRIIAALDADE